MGWCNWNKKYEANTVKHGAMWSLLLVSSLWVQACGGSSEECEGGKFSSRCGAEGPVLCEGSVHIDLDEVRAERLGENAVFRGDLEPVEGGYGLRILLEERLLSETKVEEGRFEVVLPAPETRTRFALEVYENRCKNNLATTTLLLEEAHVEGPVLEAPVLSAPDCVAEDSAVIRGEGASPGASIWAGDELRTRADGAGRFSFLVEGLALGTRSLKVFFRDEESNESEHAEVQVFRGPMVPTVEEPGSDPTTAPGMERWKTVVGEKSPYASVWVKKEGEGDWRRIFRPTDETFWHSRLPVVPGENYFFFKSEGPSGESSCDDAISELEIVIE